MNNVYQTILEGTRQGEKKLAILIDPDKFQLEHTAAFLRALPANTSHLFVGGSTVENGATEEVVKALKLCTSKPIVIFPGAVNQITTEAHALLFLSLISGDNPEYLIGQQIKAVPFLAGSNLEVIPTGYILIDGGRESAVERVTQTKPISQSTPEKIVHTAVAGQLLGMKMIYLEAGSGAATPVDLEIVQAVKKRLEIPLIVGGGITSEDHCNAVFKAGADIVVMGTKFEKR